MHTKAQEEPHKKLITRTDQAEKDLNFQSLDTNEIA